MRTTHIFLVQRDPNSAHINAPSSALRNYRFHRSRMKSERRQGDDRKVRASCYAHIRNLEGKLIEVTYAADLKVVGRTECARHGGQGYRSDYIASAHVRDQGGVFLEFYP